MKPTSTTTMAFTPDHEARLRAALHPIKEQHLDKFYKDVAARLVRGGPDRCDANSVTDAVTLEAAVYVAIDRLLPSRRRRASTS
jgi:hypothetical protein